MRVDCPRGGNNLWACEVSIPTGNQVIQITRKGWREEWVPEIMVIIGKSLKLLLHLRQLLVGTKAAGSPGNVFRVH